MSRRSVHRRRRLTGLVGLLGVAAVAAATVVAPLAQAATNWSNVDQTFQSAITQYNTPNARLSIWSTATGEHHTYPLDPTVSTPESDVIPVASASKMAATLVVQNLIYRKVMSMQTTLGQFTEFTPNANVKAVTVQDLLSFTSGLEDNPACLYNYLVTLQACAKTIATAGLKSVPGNAIGAQFRYGGGHLQVLGAMAVSAYNKFYGTNLTWNQLWDTVMTSYHVGTANTDWYGNPTAFLGAQNPMIAGGLRISIADYGKLLAIQARGGRTVNGDQFLDPAQLTEQSQQWRPNVMANTSTVTTNLYSPLQSYWPYLGGTRFNYGLGSWRECPMPPAGTAPAQSACPVVSSPGAFGFVPWVDRAHGYYGIVGMYNLTDAGSFINGQGATQAFCQIKAGKDVASMQSHCKGVGIELKVQPAVVSALAG